MPAGSVQDENGVGTRGDVPAGLLQVQVHGRGVGKEAFAERRSRADMEAFDRIPDRAGGEPPRSGDELPG